MKHVRHKRKSRQLLLVTSDAVDAGLKQYRIHPWFLYLLILLLAAAIGVLIGFAPTREKLLQNSRQRLQDSRNWWCS